MLKSLWRRTQRGQPEVPAQASHPEVEFRLSQYLTHTGSYHLERLKKLVELRFNKKFALDDDQQLRALIEFSARLHEQDIQRELLLFYLNCTPQVQVFLRSGDLADALLQLSKKAPH